MIPFKCAWSLHVKILRTPIFVAFIDSILYELEWRETKKRWKRQMPIWDKIKERGKGVKGKVATIKLSTK